MRLDIQILRAWAIILVVAYHSKAPFFNAGYLGIDIFFAISGYLVTGQLAKDYRLGRFSVTAFYKRRARRLLPAAYVVLAVTGILSPIFLDPRQLSNFYRELLAAFLFVANIVLRYQSNYFEASSDFKPLLHMWSLSLEGQYYLLLPLLYLYIRPRRWLETTFILALISAGLCFYLVDQRPQAAYYYLPTRIWELFIGGTAALLTARHGALTRAAARLFFYPAVCIFFVIPAAPQSFTHPGVDSVLMCLATVIVIGAEKVIPVNPATAALNRVGNGSYSIYLVHWPVLAWLNNIYLTPPSAAARLMGLVLVMVLAWVLRQQIEKPFQRARHTFAARRWSAIAVGMVALAISPIALPGLRKEMAVAEKSTPRTLYGLDRACNYEVAFEPNLKCRSGTADAKVLLWGDSHAMHLVPGMLASSDMAFEQATKANCAPLLTVSTIYPGTFFTPTWARQCIGFNQDVLAYVQKSPHIEVVVLASPFSQVLPSLRNTAQRTHLLIEEGDDFVLGLPSEDAALRGLGATVSGIRSSGKRVVIVASPPNAGINTQRCNNRRAEHLPLADAPPDCTIPVAAKMEYERVGRHFLRSAEQAFHVPVIYLDDAMCNETRCLSTTNGKPLFSDEAHFSQEGSRAIGLAKNLGRLAFASAR